MKSIYYVRISDVPRSLLSLAIFLFDVNRIKEIVWPEMNALRVPHGRCQYRCLVPEFCLFGCKCS